MKARHSRRLKATGEGRQRPDGKPRSPVRRSSEASPGLAPGDLLSALLIAAAERRKGRLGTGGGRATAQAGRPAGSRDQSQRRRADQQPNAQAHEKRDDMPTPPISPLAGHRSYCAPRRLDPLHSSPLRTQGRRVRLFLRRSGAGSGSAGAVKPRLSVDHACPSHSEASYAP